MKKPRDTSKEDALTHLVGMLGESMTGGNPSGYIEGMEARGQQELINSQSVPTEGSEALVSLGVVLGDPDPDDPLFRPAQLPEGWKLVPAPDHSMWNYIVDGEGKRQAAIFYKAAYYDRRAFVRLEKGE